LQRPHESPLRSGDGSAYINSMNETPADKKCRGYAEEAAKVVGRGILVQRAYTVAENPNLCIVELGPSPEESFTCKFHMVGDEEKNRAELMSQINEHLKL